AGRGLDEAVEAQPVPAPIRCYATAAVTGLGDGWGELRVVQDTPELMVADDLRQLRTGELGVDEDGVGTGRGSGQHRLNKTAVIPAHHPHTAARADPEPLTKGRRQPLDPDLQLSVADCAGLVDHRRLRRRPSGSNRAEDAGPPALHQDGASHPDEVAGTQ